MRQEIILDALDFLDESMIEAVASLRQKKKKTNVNWAGWAAVAASVCVLFLGIGTWRWLAGDTTGNSCVDGNNMSGSSDTMKSATDSGVTIPRMEVDLDAHQEADMDAFFIYQGRSYVHYEWVYEYTDFVGEYLGTATGMIDEWTPKEGYVELAGSVKGDFYEVKGFDPSFMLCMKYEDGSVATYINDNGFSLVNGSELFEDRLHLTGNYHTVEYQTRYDWYQCIGEPTALSEEYQDVIERFVEAMNQAPFMYTVDIPLDEGATNIYDDKEIYHLFFRMNNGMTVHLRLFEGGYVCFQGLTPVCVKVEETVFEELVGMLDAEKNII